MAEVKRKNIFWKSAVLIAAALFAVTGLVVWAASNGTPVDGHTVSVTLSEDIIVLGDTVTATATCTCGETAHNLNWDVATGLILTDSSLDTSSTVNGDVTITRTSAVNTAGVHTIRAYCPSEPDGATDSKDLTVIAVTKIEVMGPGDSDYVDSTEIGVGGKGSSVHKADVRITVSPVPSLPVTVPITFGGDAVYGTVVDADLQIGSTVFHGATTEDVEICDEYTYGTLKSSSDMGGCEISWTAQNGVATASADVEFKWDCHGSDDAIWEYDPYFDYDSYDPVALTIELHPGENPLDQHEMEFEVLSVTYDQYDLNTGNWVTVQATEDLDAFSHFCDDGSGNGDGIVETDSGGKAKAYQIVESMPNNDPTIFITDVWFRSTDTSVWD